MHLQFNMGSVDIERVEKLDNAYHVPQFTLETFWFADGECLLKQSDSVIN